MAAAPELQKKTWPADPVAAPTSASTWRAASSATGLAKKLETCSSVAAWRLSASVTAGWEWPSEVTARPQRKSR
jgi:hypothetical protein